LRLTPPKEILEIAAVLRNAGFEAWCVGGAVRDALLGHAHLDWDLATSATPQHVQSLFKRTVPVGIEFGTVGVLDKKQVMHEVTTFRKDVKTDGRHAVVEFGASLDDDLARRDFTINAIAYNPETDELRDPFGGQTDLKRGIVRAVGAAGDRMREDRLRALRGIRFAARFGFNIEPQTLAAIKESAPHMTRLSAERIKQELEKTMQQVERPSVALEWWREVGALAALVPIIAKVPPARFRAIDLLPETRGEGQRGEEAEGLRPDARGKTLSRLAMLFFGLETRGVEAACRQLKFSNADSSWIVSLARARQEIGEAMEAAMGRGEAAPAQLRRWIAAIGRTRTDTFCRLQGALILATNGRVDATTGKWTVDLARAAELDKFREEAVKIAFRDPIELADLAVDGEDLAKVGIVKGPALGKALKALLEIVLDDPKRNTQTHLLAAAKELV
jgi:tRNA nucleotidyltransferase (CCA-adding enzyme)